MGQAEGLRQDLRLEGWLTRRRTCALAERRARGCRSRRPLRSRRWLLQRRRRLRPHRNHGTVLAASHDAWAVRSPNREENQVGRGSEHEWNE